MEMFPFHTPALLHVQSICLFEGPMFGFHFGNVFIFNFILTANYFGSLAGDHSLICLQTLMITEAWPGFHYPEGSKL